MPSAPAKTRYTLTLTDKAGAKLVVFPDVPANPRFVVLSSDAVYLVDGLSPTHLPHEHPALLETDQPFQRVGSAVHDEPGHAAALYAEVRS